MHTHGPTCLQGPVTKGRSYWRFAAPRRPDRGLLRRELIDRVRREIAAGTYDTPEKFEAALDRLLAELDEE